MLKLKPVLKNYIWGGKKFATLYNRDNNGDIIAESWEVSVHPDGMSLTSGKSLAEHISQTPCCVDKANSPFPVLIKYIDSAQNLSVQVHPSDEYAQRVENDNGKTEMWYIIDAEPNAGIYCGFKQNTTKDEFLAKVKDGTVEELLNFIPVHKGDCFLIEAGTVHAICSGCVICEVQQSSNVTYRVYDYNRLGMDGKPRPLHVDKAVQVINFNKFQNHTNSGEVCELACGTMQLLTSCKYFTCHKLVLNKPIEFVEINNDSFTTLNVINGSGTINGEPFVAGDSFFIPRGEKFTLAGNAEIILTTK